MTSEQKAEVTKCLCSAITATAEAIRLLENEPSVTGDTAHWIESSKWWMNRAQEVFDAATARLSEGDIPQSERGKTDTEGPKASSHSYIGLVGRDANRELLAEPPAGEVRSEPSHDRRRTDQGSE